jgi:hypothetical protein
MGAGGLQSHVFDLARWDAALETDRILTAESKRAMWSPFRLPDGRWHPYGFAWAIRELPGGTVVFHNGGGDGHNNAFYRFLDARLTVIVLTNLNPNRERGSHADALARQIGALYNPALAFPDRQRLLKMGGLGDSRSPVVRQVTACVPATKRAMPTSAAAFRRQKA